jgi:DNA-directed RNA polymerase specialized sigma24 family protein
LEECSKDTRYNLIKYCDIPLLLERTLIEYYVDDLEIKEIADKHKVDERTVKAWKKGALEIAEEHLKQNLRCHFNTTS